MRGDEGLRALGLPPCTVCGTYGARPIVLGFIYRPIVGPQPVRRDEICGDCYWWLASLDVFPPSDCGTPIRQRYLHRAAGY